MANQPTCEERIDSELTDRITDIRRLMKALRVYQPEDLQDPDVRAFIDEHYSLTDESTPDEVTEAAHEAIHEYGLSVDTRTIMRVQLSWGGPSDEFEVEIEDGRVEGEPLYRFKDWWDGASRPVHDEYVKDWLDWWAEIAQSS